MRFFLVLEKWFPIDHVEHNRLHLQESPSIKQLDENLVFCCNFRVKEQLIKKQNIKLKLDLFNYLFYKTSPCIKYTGATNTCQNTEALQTIDISQLNFFLFASPIYSMKTQPAVQPSWTEKSLIFCHMTAGCSIVTNGFSVAPRRAEFFCFYGIYLAQKIYCWQIFTWDMTKLQVTHD